VSERPKIDLFFSVDPISKNPNFKTSLCQNYMTGLYCSFADRCQYAHGKHELREKPASLPPGQ
jgi:hypothetical protein